MVKRKLLLILLVIVQLTACQPNDIEQEEEAKSTVADEPVARTTAEEQPVLSVVSVEDIYSTDGVSQSEIGCIEGVNYHRICGCSMNYVYYDSEDFSDGVDIVAENLNTGEKKSVYHWSEYPYYFATRCYGDSLFLNFPTGAETLVVWIQKEQPPQIFLQYEGRRMRHIYQTKNYILTEKYSVVEGLLEGRLELTSKITGEVTTVFIARNTAKSSDEIIATGDYLSYSGGDEHNIYFEVLQLKGDSVDTPSGCTFYRYNIDEKTLEELPQWNRTGLFLSGIGPYMLISEYCYEYPLFDSGKLLRAENGQFRAIPIPGVKNGYDIYNSQPYGKYLMFNSAEFLYLFDSESERLQMIYRTDENSKVVGYNEEGAVVAEEENGKVRLILFRIEKTESER